MNKERELLKRIANYGDTISPHFIYEINELLAQPEQEPVAWMQDSIELYVLEEKSAIRGYVIPLYTAPPTREPLSDGEIRDGLDGKNGFENWYDDRFVDGVRFAEKAHGITGVDDE